MTSKNNEFFGFKVSPVDLFASVINEAIANQSGAAKTKAREFDVKSHLDNFATMGQGFFESFNLPGVFDEKEEVFEFTPAVDVLELELGVNYLVGAPGVPQGQVLVELEDTKLTITINSENIILTDQPTRNWKGGNWSQSFTVPTGIVEAPKKIDEEKISATVQNGLITVWVPYKTPVVTKIKVG